MDWLFEGNWLVYSAMALGALALLSLWWHNRKAGALVGLGILALTALLYFLLDIAIETKHEQISRKLHEMATAVKKKDAAAIVRHLSSKFAYGRTGRDPFAKQLDTWLKDGWIDELTLWEIKEEKGEIRMKAKPKGGEAARIAKDSVTFIARTTWVQDDDGQWRMSGFAVYDSFINTDRPVDVPNLPR